VLTDICNYKSARVDVCKISSVADNFSAPPVDESGGRPAAESLRTLRPSSVRSGSGSVPALSSHRSTSFMKEMQMGIEARPAGALAPNRINTPPRDSL
jgi:hypothetical protein